MAFTFVFVAFIAFFSYLFCNRIRSICPSLSSCQDLPKRRENSIPLQRHSAIRFSQPNDSPQLQPPPQITVSHATRTASNRHRKYEINPIRDKSILSNRLRVELVCDLMTIKGSGWSVDFAVDEKGDVVIDKYKQMKTRRGAVAPYTKPSYEMKRKKKKKKLKNCPRKKKNK
eukprot:69432_1